MLWTIHVFIVWLSKCDVLVFVDDMDCFFISKILLLTPLERIPGPVTIALLV